MRAVYEALFISFIGVRQDSLAKMSSPSPSIPPFRPDGYLPEGLFVCSEAEVLFRFGTSNRRRRRLALRLRRWIALGQQVKAPRLLVDGSFVTAREEPHDIDTVIFLPMDFYQQIEREYEPALELDRDVANPLPGRNLCRR